MLWGPLCLTSYTAKLGKRSGSCHQSRRRCRDCRSRLLIGLRKHEKQHSLFILNIGVEKRLDGGQPLVFMEESWSGCPASANAGRRLKEITNLNNNLHRMGIENCILGIPYLGLDGCPAFRHTEALPYPPSQPCDRLPLPSCPLGVKFPPSCGSAWIRDVAQPETPLRSPRRYFW
jgi:hypothetical protein